MKNTKRLITIFSTLLFLFVFSISVSAMPQLNKTNVELIKGQTVQLKLSGTSEHYVWTSGNSSIASIDNNGKVTAKNNGETWVAAVGDTFYMSCLIRVVNVSINKTSLTMKVGDTKHLKIKGTYADVKWKSSSKKLAVVTKNGEVSALQKGIAVISATVLGKTFYCTINVVDRYKNDSILSGISQKMEFGKYYGSDWKKAMVLTLKNRSGFDLKIEAELYYWDGQRFSYVSSETAECVRFGSEMALIFNDVGKATANNSHIRYKVSKISKATRNLYDCIAFTTKTEIFDMVVFEASSPTIKNAHLNPWIIYYNSNGKIIDFAFGGYYSGELPFNGDFDLPVSKKLDSGEYDHYKVFYNLEYR